MHTIFFLIALLAPGLAFAQFTPGTPLKAADLNAALAAPAIVGGSINGAPIGQTTPAAGAFTGLTAGGVTLGSGVLQVANLPGATQYVRVVGGTTTPSRVEFVGPDNRGGSITVPGCGPLTFYLPATSPQFRVACSNGAVNYWQAEGSGVGAAPNFTVQGDATDIGGGFVSKGTGSFEFKNGAGPFVQFRVGHTNNAVNFAQLRGAANGQAPRLDWIGGLGSDGNVGGTYATSGVGGHTFASHGGAAVQVVMTGVASAVNHIRLSGAPTGNAASVVVSGSDANRSLTLSAAGTGVINHTNPITITRTAPLGTAPGAGIARLEVVCGTNAGTAKLVMTAGTLATAVTVVDNVGAGVTGC